MRVYLFIYLFLFIFIYLFIYLFIIIAILIMILIITIIIIIIINLPWNHKAVLSSPKFHSCHVPAQALHHDAGEVRFSPQPFSI